jgi:hypothetical protein
MLLGSPDAFNQLFYILFMSLPEQETRALRVNDVHTLIHRLPQQNRDMLDIIIKHLKK